MKLLLNIFAVSLLALFAGCEGRDIEARVFERLGGKIPCFYCVDSPDRGCVSSAFLGEPVTCNKLHEITDVDVSRGPVKDSWVATVSCKCDKYGRIQRTYNVILRDGKFRRFEEK